MTVTDLFEQHINVKQYNGIVRTMIEWYYNGKFQKVAWCAISMSYMANQLGILDQFGGKNQNCYRMLCSISDAVKRTGKGKVTYASDLNGKTIKRGTVIFTLSDDPPMTAKSRKHVTTAYEDFAYKGKGYFKSLGGNQSGAILVKQYSQKKIYAIYEPDYDKTLRKGDKGEEVKELQKLLNKLGYPDNDYKALKVDGSFGAKTEQAVKCFQKYNSLKVDGVCSPKTWDAITKALSAPPKLVKPLKDVVVRSGPSSIYKKKTTLKKGTTVAYSFMKNKWLYVPQYGGWITSKQKYVTMM